MSNHTSGSPINFFARELQAILAARGLGIGVIDDRGTGIHRTVVQRLQKALVPPGNFSMLNPDDLDKVIKTFNLEPLEVIRLRAAIIANAIMQILIDRIPFDDALDVTEKVYKDVVTAMRKGTKQFSRIRKISNSSGSLDLEEMLEYLLPSFDRGIIALQLGEDVLDETERREYLQQARICFEAAQQTLDEVGPEVKQMEIWQEWHLQLADQLSEVEEEIENE